ncbi:MAG: hypothetical protein WD928_18355 [Gammaproteobacteria bacterium]
MIQRLFSIALVAALATGCATQTIAPTYSTDNPNIQVGGQRPVDGMPEVVNAGSFCLQVTDKWHQDGKTPDGTALWAKDTHRKVVPCT